MNFSCKISHAALTYFEREGEDLTLLYDRFPLPVELLKDPSYWVTAHEMETFLQTLQSAVSNVGSELNGEGTFQKIGHLSSELKSWGVLDHVLRMMPKPFEIFHHPESLIAHFIAPRPPIEHLRMTPNAVEFDWPILQQEFPLVSEYLKAAFEAIPTYMGLSPAQCTWEGIHLKMSWDHSQASLLDSNEARQISPEFFRSVIDEIQKNSHRTIEKAMHRFTERAGTTQVTSAAEAEAVTETLETAKIQAQGLGQIAFIENTPENSISFIEKNFVPQVSGLDRLERNEFRKLAQNMAKLNDYMYRAQQIITIYSQSEKTRSISKQLLQKTDWKYIRERFPQILQDSFDLLKELDLKTQQTNELKGEKDVENR